MEFGSPEFVLAIIGMAMFAGVLKASVRAKHGLPEHGGGKRARGAEIAHLRDENASQVSALRSENARLTSRLEAHEDRLIVLEKIVTDRGYTLAHEIEALRDQRPLEARRSPTQIEEKI